VPSTVASKANSPALLSYTKYACEELVVLMVALGVKVVGSEGHRLFSAAKDVLASMMVFLAGLKFMILPLQFILGHQSGSGRA